MQKYFIATVVDSFTKFLIHKLYKNFRILNHWTFLIFSEYFQSLFRIFLLRFRLSTFYYWDQWLVTNHYHSNSRQNGPKRPSSILTDSPLSSELSFGLAEDRPLEGSDGQILTPFSMTLSFQSAVLTVLVIWSTSCLSLKIIRKKMKK